MNHKEQALREDWYKENVDVKLDPESAADYWLDILRKEREELMGKVEGMKRYAETQPMATLDANTRSLILRVHVTAYNSALEDVKKLLL